MLEGATIHDAFTVCPREGELRNIMATKSPLVSKGQIVGIVGYFEDLGPHRPEP